MNAKLSSEKSVRRGALASVFAAVLLSATLLVAPPALAAAADCGSGQFCLWTNGNFEGTRQGWTGNKTSYNSTMSNKATSIYNRGNSCDIRIYADTSYAGHNDLVPRGNQYSNLALWWWGGNPFTSWNDQIESHRWVC